MKRLIYLFACLALCLSASPSHALLDRLFGKEAFPFKVEVANRNKLAESLTEDLSTQRGQSDEFQLIEQRSRVVQFDRRILTKLLEARGHYASSIRVQGEEGDLVYLVDPGPSYTIAAIELDFPEGVEGPALNRLPSRQGRPMRAAEVLATQSALREHVQSNYCLFNINLTYTAQVDHSTAKAYLRFRLAPSPAAVFGPSEITGLTSVKPGYMRRHFTIEEGQCFSRTEIERTRLRLLQTNLIGRAEVKISQPVDDVVAVTFELSERNHRTVQAGVGWDGDLGEGISLGWQHRNLFGRGQILDLNVTKWGEVEERGSAQLTLPHFVRTGVDLVFHANVTRATPDAFATQGSEFGVTLERALENRWAGSIGTVVEFPTVERFGERQSFSLLSFPINVQHNRTDSLLNPTRGWSASVLTQPFIDLQETDTQFVKTSVTGSAYFSATQSRWSPTLALRAAAGTISGVGMGRVPFHHRYYVGGGGSVRGYNYQTLGTIVEHQDSDTGDIERVPEGGLSFGEAGLELRLRVAESWGVVLFTDGGYAYSDRLPPFGQDFLWGAGVGVRYFTSFAPIRFDIATPMTRRTYSDGNRIDSSVQLYISIGQAF